VPTVTVLSGGQIALPERIRDELSIGEGDQVEVRREGSWIVIHPTALHPEGKDWRAWRGTLAGTTTLEGHLREHREEVARRVCLEALPLLRRLLDEPGAEGVERHCRRG